MARKVLNRKELRQEGEAAERIEAAAGKKTGTKPATKTAKTPRKTRAKVVKEVRLKAFWGVFSQSLKTVALFEYNEREQADDKAETLNKSGKSPHFVQLVKKVIEE